MCASSRVALPLSMLFRENKSLVSTKSVYLKKVQKTRHRSTERNSRVDGTVIHIYDSLPSLTHFVVIYRNRKWLPRGRMPE